MKVSIRAAAIGYIPVVEKGTGSILLPRMVLEFEEKGDFAKTFLSVELDRDQAHNTIEELKVFCREAGHPLYQAAGSQEPIK